MGYIIIIIKVVKESWVECKHFRLLPGLSQGEKIMLARQITFNMSEIIV